MYLSIILISFASFAFSEPIVESIDCRDAIALAGQDLMVNLTLQSKAQYVYIQYQINYGPSLNTSMAAGESNRFRAIIPASSFKVGDMVRWKFFVDDQGHMWTFDYSSGNSSSWCGTCIQDNSPLSKIPTLAWWTPNGSESLTVAGADGGSLCFGGRFYDNVSTKRRGVTSLSFKKPKLSFKVDGGGFEFLKGRMNVKSFDLSNLFFELGEKSMMKEMVALDFLQLAGVVSSISYYVQVVRNGQWFGLWGMLEVVDAVFLEQRGIDPSGPLFKSSAAEESNLRFDIPTDQLHFYYNKENRKSHPEDWDLLNNLTFSLAGGGPLTRSNFLLQGLDLPSIINQMAAQTLVLNMDRCTKNFFVHLDNSSSRWRMIPWDLDASFGQVCLPSPLPPLPLLDQETDIWIQYGYRIMGLVVRQVPTLQSWLSPNGTTQTIATYITTRT